MPVNDTRRDYDNIVKGWKLVRDVVISNARHYIKDIDVTDPTRCKQYKDEAQFTNFTTRTKHGLLGAVFRRDPIITLPEDIQYLQNDATGFRMPLDKFLQECVGEVLMTGRYGLLVDYPSQNENLTQAEIEARNLKARIYRYTAENIINWQEVIVDGAPVLSLVVLKEVYDSLGDDGFQWIEKTQYRVLRLIDGIYHQQIYVQQEAKSQSASKQGSTTTQLDSQTGNEFTLVAEYVPTNARGEVWNYIPFIFLGSEDNDSAIDPAPMYDLAMLNVGHLRNSADFEESVHIVGQPTLIISTEMSQEEFANANPGGVKIGARKGYNLGINGKAVFLQASPNQLADEAMKRKEEQAIMVGARLISHALDRETATAAKMRHSGETSILATICSNVEQGVELACAYIMCFMSTKPMPLDDEYDEDGDEIGDDQNLIDIQLNRQFFDKDLDPNLVMAQIQLLINGLVAKSDVRNILRAYGVIDQERSDEEIDQENKTDTPPAMIEAPDPIVSEE